MSKLQELIDRLCPDGVPFKTLEDIGTFYGGLSGKSKEDFKEGNAKFVTYMNIYSNPSLNLDIHDRVKVDRFEKQNLVEKGDILFTGSSETPNECGLTSVVTQNVNEPIYLNSFCFGLRLNNIEAFNLDFLKHLFRSDELRGKISKTASGVTRFNVSKARLAKVTLPVPPLEVQNEIAKILDRFAVYAAELQAELQARKEQYEYYRNLLLTFNPSACGCGTDGEQKINDVTTWGGHSYKIAWKPMGEICKFKYGYTDKASDSGNARYIRITDINDSGRLLPKDAKYINIIDDNKEYVLKTGDLVMARTGATFGKTLLFEENYKAIYASFLIKLQLNNDIILNRYYWHFSKSQLYWSQANKLVSTGGQPQFNANAISQVMVPIPPMELQEKIVAILDRFETLVNDLSAGLPAEIAAVKQRYEYYRNKLLTFNEIC